MSRSLRPRSFIALVGLVGLLLSPIVATGASAAPTVVVSSSAALKTFSHKTPTVSGTARTGKTLTAVTSKISPKPTKITYQWKRNGVVIAKATKRTYKVVSGDFGMKISVSIVASKSGYRSAAATSTAQKVVGPTPPKNTDKKQKVEAGSYVTGKTSDCMWLRLSKGSKDTSFFDSLIDDPIGSSLGAGQRIVTIKSSDKWFQAHGCGAWKNVETLKPLTKIPSDGVFVVGQQIEPGLWATSGPIDEDDGCFAESFSAFGGEDGQSISWDKFTESAEVQISSDAVGFQSENCGAWTRVEE